jgi:uncharacterized membrane protein
MRKITVLIGTLFILFTCSKAADYPEAPFDGSNVTIDIRMLKDGIPVFYTFKHGGEKINYIILRIGDDIQAYYDACAECYPRKRGFRYEDGSLICNVCNVEHAMHTLKEGKGSCYPFKLAGQIRGNVYEIDKDTIIQGKKYF